MPLIRLRKHLKTHIWPGAMENSSYSESILGLVQVKIKKKEYTLAMKDINRAELLAKSVKTTQFKGQIKQARAAIAEKKSATK